MLLSLYSFASGFLDLFVRFVVSFSQESMSTCARDARTNSFSRVVPFGLLTRYASFLFIQRVMYNILLDQYNSPCMQYILICKVRFCCTLLTEQESTKACVRDVLKFASFFDRPPSTWNSALFY